MDGFVLIKLASPEYARMERVSEYRRFYLNINFIFEKMPVSQFQIGPPLEVVIVVLK